MGIAAILMAIIVPTFVGMARQHRQATCAANLKAIGQALALFHEDYGCYPPDCTEYLWTPAAVQEYARLYPENPTPPGDHRLGTLTGAACHPDGRPFAPDATSYQYYNNDPQKPESQPVHGRGLLTLYYLGAYASVLPPLSSDPRFTQDLFVRKLLTSGKGFSQFDWFRGSGYITKLNTFHCPANDATYTQSDLVTNRELPSLQQYDVATDQISYWNNYDEWYRRNWWPRDVPGLPLQTWAFGMPPQSGQDHRNLWEAFPPVDTVVTWCPYHRRGEHHTQPHGPQGPHAGDKGGGGFYHPEPDKSVVTGDKDLVLFVDGSVRRMTSREDNKMYDASVQDAGWPEGPVM